MPTAAYQLSRRAKSYWNAGTYASPVWTLITNLRDETVDGATTNVDVSVRDVDDTLTAPVGHDYTVTGQQVKNRANAFYLVMEAAYDALTPIEILTLDGPVGTTGSRGLRATYAVTKFTENRAYTDIQLIDFELKPTLTENPAPARFVA